MNSPKPLTSLSSLADKYTRTGMHLGAGTVLTPAEADAAAGAGATFLVSPHFDPAVVRQTKKLGLISIPGFFTPSEAFAATAAGADYLKCFPVDVLGPGYIKALKAVLATPIIAVGGVNIENLSGFLKVSAGVGVGSNLYSPQKAIEDIRKDAAMLIRSARPAS
jgi:2-dehydro-3-deoxyphosphogalactonate aldolase